MRHIRLRIQMRSLFNARDAPEMIAVDKTKAKEKLGCLCCKQTLIVLFVKFPESIQDRNKVILPLPISLGIVRCCFSFLIRKYFHIKSIMPPYQHLYSKSYQPC